MKKPSKKKRDFDDIWDLIEIPVYILVGYSLLDLILSVNSYIDKLFPSWIFSTALTIFAFGLIGYKAIKQKIPSKTNDIAKYGAYAGLITGFVSAIIGLITFYFFPEKIAEALQKAAEAGADVAMAQTFMKIGLYINLVLSPAINAGIGALIAWISGMVFNSKK